MSSSQIPFYPNFSHILQAKCVRHRYRRFCETSGILLWGRGLETFLRSDKSVRTGTILTNLHITDYVLRWLFRWGVVSFADSLDCVGILGKSVSSVERVFGKFNTFS